MKATYATAHDPHALTAGAVGQVSAEQAWDALRQDAAAQLIDVRTQPEWVFCGTPNLSGLDKRPHLISWKFYPTMETNSGFVSAVMALAPQRETPLYFLCKSGGRSQDAATALAQAGYTRCFNISDGFEGERDAQGRRGIINGWKAAGLPWEQA